METNAWFGSEELHNSGVERNVCFNLQSAVNQLEEYHIGVYAYVLSFMGKDENVGLFDATLLIS